MQEREEKIMICAFFGHREVIDDVKKAVKNRILNLIQNYSEIEFYVGNSGAFGKITQGVVSDIQKQGISVSLSVVLAYANEAPAFGYDNETIFPWELDNVLPRFAISKRNDWILNRADIVIVYVRHRFSNSYKIMQKAIKKGLTVINIADDL